MKGIRPNRQSAYPSTSINNLKGPIAMGQRCDRVRGAHTLAPVTATGSIGGEGSAHRRPDVEGVG